MGRFSIVIGAVWLLILSGCESKRPEWITESLVQSLQFAGSKPFQVFNLSQSDVVSTAIAVEPFSLEKAFEVDYYLDGGDTARLYVYLFDTEISAFGAFKAMGGLFPSPSLTLKWYKNALFQFSIRTPNLFSKELHAFEREFPAESLPAAFKYYPLQNRVPQSETVSLSGVLGNFAADPFTSIEYALLKDKTTPADERVTLSMSESDISADSVKVFLAKNRAIQNIEYKGFEIFLVELIGQPVWISHADGRLLVVFGSYDLKKSLEFIKKSLNIQKILN